MTLPLSALWGLAALIVGGYAVNIPDSYLGPIVVLFISGVITFAAWLVKTGQSALAQARDSSASTRTAVESIKAIDVRVTELERWRLRTAESRRRDGQGEEGAGM